MLILAAQTKFNLSHVNKIESLHGIMGKNLHPINSAPPNSKTEGTLLQIDRQTQREGIKLEKHLYHRGSKVPKLEFVNRLRCFSRRCEISF